MDATLAREAGGAEVRPDVQRCCNHALEIQALQQRLTALEAKQPVEPLYSLSEAALLIPCSASTLRRNLTLHRDTLQPALYRWDQLHRSHRLLYASDVLALRGRITHRSQRGYRLRQALKAQQIAA